MAGFMTLLMVGCIAAAIVMDVTGSGAEIGASFVVWFFAVLCGILAVLSAKANS